MEIYLALQEKREDRDRRRVGCDGGERTLREGVIRRQGIRKQGEGSDGEKNWTCYKVR